MFGFNTHRAVREAELEAEVALLEADLKEARAVNGRIKRLLEGVEQDNRSLASANYALDRAAALHKQACDEAREQLKPFLARREKAKQNLRQYRKPADTGVAVQH